MEKLVIGIYVAEFAIGIGAVIVGVKVKYVNDKKMFEEFSNVLDKAFEKGNINTIEDIQLLFNMKRKGNLFRLTRYLEQYTAEIICGNKSFKNDKISEMNLISDIQSYIKEIKSQSPFDKLPENDKVICNDILNYINNKDEISAIEKLHTLSNMIYLREESYEKIKRSNRFSIPIAIAGIILTTIFGIVSLR